MKLNFKKGFTLIELLVVIAIIGILSGIVLSSLNSARGKGNDAKVKAQLSSMRAAMETYYAGVNNYGTSATTNGCSASPAAAPWNDSASGMLNLADTDNYPSYAGLTCFTSGTAWAAEGQLDNGTANNTFLCVDSSGAVKENATTLLGGTAPDTAC